MRQAVAAAVAIALLVGAFSAAGPAQARLPEQATARAIRAANYILSNQDPGGAIRDAANTTAVNMDNNMNYAMVGLAAAFQATRVPRFLEGMRRGLLWLASVQEADGAWHWGYLTPQYRPFVSEYYRALGITDIKGVDAIQAYYAYTLFLYVQLSGDRGLRERLLPTARSGIEYLIAHNYDGRFFYSSWQQRGGQWYRLDQQYSAGQADVFLGLMAMWRLSGEARYLEMALRLRRDLRVFFRQDAWGISRDDASGYRFSNGYLPYVFGIAEGLRWLAGHQDGSAIAAASLALGLQANGLPADEPLGALADLQGPRGGVAVSSDPAFRGYYYTNDAGFAILAWLGGPFTRDLLSQTAPVR